MKDINMVVLTKTVHILNQLTFVKLCYAICFTVNIIIINFGKHSFDLIYVVSLFGPEGLTKSISGPWPKKVVHHCLSV